MHGPTMYWPIVLVKWVYNVYLFDFLKKKKSIVLLAKESTCIGLNLLIVFIFFIFLDLDSAGLYILENICFEARAYKVVAIIIQDKGTILIFQERG